MLYDWLARVPSWQLACIITKITRKAMGSEIVMRSNIIKVPQIIYKTTDNKLILQINLSFSVIFLYAVK